MDISELLEKEITNLPPGEKVRALGELLDIIQLETDRISSESRQTFILPVSSIEVMTCVSKWELARIFYR